MSYCRWSSDNFACDVYVYEHVDGTWTTHVASNRITSPLPPAPDFHGLLSGSVSAEEYAAQSRAQHEALDEAERAPLGLPHDGETFKDSGPAECAERLLTLRALGYQVPQYAVDALLAEALPTEPNTNGGA